MPEKLYRIGDAAQLLGLKTYVLRYWETEFSQLRPVRTGKGQRRYTEADMAVLTRIRYLLHEQGMTIEGARKVLAGASALSLAVEPDVPGLRETGDEPVQVAPVQETPERASGAGPDRAQAEKAAREKETLIQLSLDFVVPPRLKPETSTGVSPAEALRDEAVTPVADEARLKRITDELRALQKLLRRQ